MKKYFGNKGAYIRPEDEIGVAFAAKVIVGDAGQGNDV
jgi:hypothetical protein